MYFMNGLKDLDEATTKVKALVEHYKGLAEDTIPKIVKLEEIPKGSLVGVYIDKAFMSSRGHWGAPSKLTTSEAIDKKLAEYEAMATADIQAIEAAHERNLPLIKNNEEVIAKVTKLMEHIGIPKQTRKSHYKSSRSMKIITETVSSGWITDLSEHVKVKDYNENYKQNVISALEAIKRKAQEEKATIAKEAAIKAAEIAKKEADKALIKMQLKYELDDCSEWEDVLDIICSKCKYLNLAWAMEQTRNDWSEGFGKVGCALDKFVVTSEEDHEIEKCIDECLEGCEDGRTFRDCKYNYSVLYAKVAKELMDDFDVARQHFYKY